jgi:hypothetical protein
VRTRTYRIVHQPIISLIDASHCGAVRSRGRLPWQIRN